MDGSMSAARTVSGTAAAPARDGGAAAPPLLPPRAAPAAVVVVVSRARRSGLMSSKVRVGERRDSETHSKTRLTGSPAAN
jgi:hypothetical protein